MYNKDNFLNSFCQFLSFYCPYLDYFMNNIFTASKLLSIITTYILSQKCKKALQSRLFIIPFIQRFLGFYEQSNTLGGSLLPYRFVVNSLLYDSYPMGRTSASTSLIPQLVQAVILPQHVVLVNFYIIERKG